MSRKRGHQVHTLNSDLLDIQALEAEISASEPEVVAHLAAISYVGHSNPCAFYQVNVIGTMNFLGALLKLPCPPKRILLSSSANVYGNSPTSPIPETQEARPVNHYATSKLAMEHMSRTILDRLPIFWTRPFNYTGPGQALDFLIPKLVQHAASRSERIELGNLNIEREFNDIRFVCEAYLSLLENAEPGETYNICTGKTYNLKTVLETLKDLTGHSMATVQRADLIRENEIQRLCGSPEKLEKTTGSLQKFTLRNTLAWMLNDATGQNGTMGQVKPNQLIPKPTQLPPPGH